MNSSVKNVREFNRDDVTPAVRGFLHVPAKPSAEGLVLTHGAGASCQSRLLIVLAEAFCEAGMTVLRCDLPFRQASPYGPPVRGSAERDQEGLRRAVESLRQEGAERVFLGGHSYGGRQASMLAASAPGIAEGLLLLSYPLHPPKRPEQMRTAHFPELRTPSLFIQGSKDGFATPEEMTAVLKLTDTKTALVILQGAGHELMSKRNQGTFPNEVVESFRKFFGCLGEL